MNFPEPCFKFCGVAYLLLIEYDGTDFYGWQIQPKVRTVQGELLGAARRLFNDKNLRIIGASRTDRGVHAVGQVACIFTQNEKSPEEVKRALNALTGADLYVKAVRVVDDDFNPRFQAKSKVYRYRVLSGRSPLRRRFVWEYTPPLDFTLLEETANIYKEIKDFAHLSVEKERNTEVEIFQVKWLRHGDEFHFLIEANRFLNKMVRILVGMSVSIASGKAPAEWLRGIRDGIRPKRIVVAPPQGLCLEKVVFDDD